MADRRCDNCRFVGAIVTTCHPIAVQGVHAFFGVQCRHGPAPPAGEDGYPGMWPTMWPSDWCYRHKFKKGTADG